MWRSKTLIILQCNNLYKGLFLNIKTLFLHQETKQDQQVHRDAEGEVHPAGPARR